MNINTLSHKSAEFPKNLHNINPKVNDLYFAGSISHTGPTLSIIGTRRPSTYGTVVIEQIMHLLAKYDVCIVSGLALGVDSLAHRAALKHKLKTWAVLPSPPNRVYPVRHAGLANQIIEEGGALISEYNSESAINRGSFIARNRIIAGLSDLVVIIEATEKSGTMHTVQFALQMGVEVAAVPGPINAVNSSGTNSLIKQGAHIITRPEDLLELLNIPLESSKKKQQLTAEHEAIVTLLQNESLSFDKLLAATGRKREDLLIQIAQLEIAAQIKTLPDGTYICIR